MVDDNDLKNTSVLSHQDRLMILSHSLWGVRSSLFSLHEYEILLASTGVVRGIRERCCEFIKMQLRDMGYESAGLVEEILEDSSEEDN